MEKITVLKESKKKRLSPIFKNHFWFLLSHLILPLKHCIKGVIPKGQKGLNNFYKMLIPLSAKNLKKGLT